MIDGKGKQNICMHSFTGHNSLFTDIVVGYGGSNAIIISSSVDRTCEVRHSIELQR